MPEQLDLSNAFGSISHKMIVDAAQAGQNSHPNH